MLRIVREVFWMRLYGLNNALRPSTLELIDYSNLLFHNIRGKWPAAWKQRLAAVKHASPRATTTAPFGHVHKRVLIPTFKSPVSLCCCPPPASPAAAHLSVRAAPRLIGSVPPWTLICLPVGVAAGVGAGAHGGISGENERVVRVWGSAVLWFYPEH